jgi:hypothetical protein
MLVKLLKFDLPLGAGGMSAQMARSLIIRRFERFRKEHGIEFKYQTAGYEFFVWFTKDSDYTYFTLVYDLNDDWRPYTLLEKEITGEQD